VDKRAPQSQRDNTAVNRLDANTIAVRVFATP